MGNSYPVGMHAGDAVSESIIVKRHREFAG